jgi:hypothetical protein
LCILTQISHSCCSLSVRGVQNHWEFQYSLFWKGLTGVAAVGCHPLTQGMPLGHRFLIVLWHTSFPWTLFPNPEFRGDVHLLSHLGHCLLTKFFICWTQEIKGQSPSCPFQLVNSVCWEDSSWVTWYDPHEFPSLISVLILIAKQTCKTAL